MLPVPRDERIFGLKNHGILFPLYGKFSSPDILILAWVWGEASESAFLTSSQVVPMLLCHGTNVDWNSFIPRVTSFLCKGPDDKHLKFVEHIVFDNYSTVLLQQSHTQLNK